MTRFRDSSVPVDRWRNDRNHPLVVYCSGNSWSSPVGTDRHMASRLAKTARVLYVDPPLPIRPKNIDRVRSPSFEQIGDNLWRLSPLSPPGVTRPVVRSIAAALARRAILRSVESLGCDVHAVVVSSLDPLLEACESSHRVFFGTDDFRAGAELMGLSRPWVERRELEQLASATVVVAVSEQLADRWRRVGCDVVTIPNGCDVEAFAETDTVPQASDITLPPPIAGIVGQLNDRIDLDTVEAVADTGVSLLLVGPICEPIDRQRLDGLIGRTNVQWVDRRPFDTMPTYLKAIKVGLTPYANNEFNRGSSPLKTLEYLAAGRDVVATDLPAARALKTDLIAMTNDPTEFARIVVRQLAAEDSEEMRIQRRLFASQHGWERRVSDFVRVLGLTPPEATSGFSD